MAYIGASPSNGIRRKYKYTATAAQTSFTNDDNGITVSYVDSLYVDVFQNGVKLAQEDYTSTTGTSVVLVQAASADDIIEIIVFDVFGVADTVSQSAGGNFAGNVGMGGTLSVTGVATATTFQPNGDTAAGDNAAIGYTAAEGLILTGQGSTDDITIKNDADTTIVNVATGATDVEISAGNLLFGTASKGVYLGVTSATAANLLGDYEEGTFTPTWNSYTPAASSGKFVKVGNQVTVYTSLITNTADDASAVSITNLPFTISGNLGSGTLYHNTAGLRDMHIVTDLVSNSTTCRLHGVLSGSDTTIKYVGTDPALGGSSTLIWILFYQTI
jgi:hypothetical protein